MSDTQHDFSGLLKAVPFFKDLSDHNRAHLSKLLEVKELERDALLFHRGDIGDSMYIVAKGEIELFIDETTGEKISLTVSKKGDFFGELSLLDSGPRTASARAQTNAIVLVLQQREFLTFLEFYPEVMFELLRTLTARLRNANDMIQMRSAKNSNEVIETNLTRLQKLASWAADFSGSLAFFFINAVVIGLWMTVNYGLIDSIPMFDPYPFGGLAFFVSVEALFLSIIVLCGQNLQSTAEKVRNDIEYETNLKAELEVVHLHSRIEHLQQEVLSRLHRIEKGRA